MSDPRHSPFDESRALRPHANPVWRSYAAAILLVALATVLTWLLARLIGGERPRFPFAIFFPTVIVLTRYGGRAAGWFAIALSALVSSFFFIPPLYSFRIGSDGLLQVGVFLFITLLTTYLMERSTRAEMAQFRLAAIVKSSDDAILSKTLDGIITSWNVSAEKMYGYSAAEVVGKHVSLIIPPERSGELTEILKRMRRGEAIEHLETRRVKKDGAVVEVSLSISPIKDSAGRLVGASTIARDISERRQAEAAVQESEQRLLAIAETASDAIITIDEDSQILFVNSAAVKIFGYASEEMIGHSLTMLMPDYVRLAHERALHRHVETGRRHISWDSIELPGLHKTGREIALEVSFAEFMKDGKHFFSGVARDITERKRTEEAMRASEERYRYLAEAMPQIVWTARPDGYIDYYNTRWFEYTGMTLEETEGWGWQPVLHPDDLEPCLKSWSKSVTTGERYDIEYRFKRASDGVYRWHLGRAEPMRDAAGQIVKWFGTATDIHDRKQVAESLRFMSEASELLTSSLNYEATLERLARLCVAALADYCLIDVVEDDGEMRRVATAHRDPSQEELVHALKRYPPDTSRTEGVSNVIRTGRPEIVAQLSAEKLQEITSDNEHGELLRRLRLKSYMTLPLRTRERVVGALTFAMTGEGRSYTPANLSFAQELARRAALAIDNARLYSRAQAANKAKDEFLATLSHELRTPLTPIIGWLQMIRDGRISDADTRHGLAIIEKNSQALARLINDLLDMSSILSGKMRIERAPVEVGAALQEAVETIRQQAESRGIPVEFAASIGDAHATVSGDRTRLVQVFWNLLNNAVKFSDAGQRITAGCETRDGEVRVTITDEGRGMEPEFLPHAFERFRQADSSTTRIYGGLGIGLALVKSFVEAHDGTTTVESEGAGRGSRFTVTLPRLDAPANAGVEMSPEAVETCAAEGVCRVLVIEDVPDTLDMLQVVFETRGYQVTPCSTAEEALRVAQTAAFDIIVSDIGLPQIDGYELIRRLRAIPHLRDVPAVALTGYAAPRDAESALDAGFDVHVPKPVDPATLANEIEQLLQRRARHEDAQV